MNKVESFHAFSQHLNFGNSGIITSSNPAEQEKRVVYNQLVSNAVMLQNVADQTQDLNALRKEGRAYDPDALAALSPDATKQLRRFGKYRTDYSPEPMPETAITEA